MSLTQNLFVSVLNVDLSKPLEMHFMLLNKFVKKNLKFF